MILWFPRNWFVVGLIAAVALAGAFPEAGASGGWLRAEITTKIAVAMLFLIRGMLLPLKSARQGLVSWRLHVVVHAFMFILIPLLAVALMEGTRFLVELPFSLRTGFFLLATLPTTVSTSSVFTSLTHGNTTAAVFNATVSNLLGVVLAPLAMDLFFATSAAGALPIAPIIGQVAILVVAPLIAGQIIKRGIWDPGLKECARFESVSSLIVLFIIFAAFANSVEGGAWRGHGLATLALVIVYAAGLFGLASALAVAAGRLLRFDRQDRIVLFFCGSQKTIVLGAPIANLMFPGDPALSLILLPILVYYFIQSFIGGALIDRIKRGAGERG